MTEHRFILEPYKGMKTRFICPACQRKDKTFSLYIDTETGKHVHPNVGRCNRESNCGNHYTPKQYFQDNNISFDIPQRKVFNTRPVAPQQKPVSFIPFDSFKPSLKAYDANNFVTYLINLFGIKIASELVSRYFIATSKHWNGATVFWQIDLEGRVRTGKIMLYSPVTGKRIKEPSNCIAWVHKSLKQPNFELRQCLFGEHLLFDKIKPVAIVESEKTAVIASIYLPQFIWVAVGSLTNLNAEKCSILKGRTITLFPDLKGFEKWSNKAKELSHLAIFTVSELLERKATEAEREQGLDLADYLIKYDYKEFAEPEATEPPETVQQLSNAIKGDMLTNTNIPSCISNNISSIQKPESWEQDIIELENYFAEIAITPQPVMLNKCSTITNYSLFIESHIATIRQNNRNKTFLPYINRLKELKGIFQSSLII